MRAIFAVVLLCLAGCKQEPSFDQRFEDAQKQLEAKSAGIENDLRAAESDAAEADAAATGVVAD